MFRVIRWMFIIYIGDCGLFSTDREVSLRTE